LFDHITLRVPDLAAASSAFAAVLDALEIRQTANMLSFSVWGNFALTQTDEQHPIARRVHIAFIAPTPTHVDRSGQGGINAGFADDGPAGPRPKYAKDYYAASLKDHAGNGFEAVHRNGQRPGGTIDHIVIRAGLLAGAGPCGRLRSWATECVPEAVIPGCGTMPGDGSLTRLGRSPGESTMLAVLRLRAWRPSRSSTSA
jgi:catechol 2,3-dioxygenase-like lactoylglutathione lyase family enzyme